MPTARPMWHPAPGFFQQTTHFTACNKLNPPPLTSTDPTRCPLCGRLNDCQLCTSAAYKGLCWCMRVEIPEALLARVSPELSKKTCICQNCLAEFHRSSESAAPRPKIFPGDFYFDGGLMVFTAEYHRRRGYCCGSVCRHCPYQRKIISSSLVT